MGTIFLSGGYSATPSASGGAGIPPSNCYKLGLEKTNIVFYAWKNANGDIVLTTSATPTTSDKIFVQSGDVFTQTDNVVTSYDSETTSIVVNGLHTQENRRTIKTVLKMS